MGGRVFWPLLPQNGPHWLTEVLRYCWGGEPLWLQVVENAAGTNWTRILHARILENQNVGGEMGTKTPCCESVSQYCWWKKSCTSWYGKYPIIYKVSCMLGGAGFLPSTVFHTFTMAIWRWWTVAIFVVDFTRLLLQCHHLDALVVRSFVGDWGFWACCKQQ